MISIPQSVARRCYLKAYLTSDHVSPATGKTLACVISKNGASFANPHAGATNATEIGSGWYYVDLDTTDTATKGPLQVRATASGVDDVEPEAYEVMSAHNAGFDGVPDVAAGASSGLPLSVDSSGRVDVLKVNGTSQTARDLGATLGAAGAGLTAIPTVAHVTLVDTLTTYTSNTPQTGDAFGRIGAPAGASVSADVAAIKTDTAAIKTKTDNIPASPAAVGSAMTLTSGERNAVADAMFDRADAIEVGLTLRQSQRLALAALAGKLSGATAGADCTVTFRNAVADSKNRIIADVDSDGNRTTITIDIT